MSPRHNQETDGTQLFCIFMPLNLLAFSVTWFTAHFYEGWNFNSGNYLFTTDTKEIHVSKFYCPSM